MLDLQLPSGVLDHHRLRNFFSELCVTNDISKSTQLLLVLSSNRMRSGTTSNHGRGFSAQQDIATAWAWSGDPVKSNSASPDVISTGLYFPCIASSKSFRSMMQIDDSYCLAFPVNCNSSSQFTKPLSLCINFTWTLKCRG